MRIISWNVNGLRAILAKNFTENIQFLDPDILCLQEIKVKPSQLSKLVLCNIRGKIRGEIRSNIRGKIRNKMFSVEQGERGGE
jgi:hypothetical protein